MGSWKNSWDDSNVVATGGTAEQVAMEGQRGSGDHSTLRSVSPPTPAGRQQCRDAVFPTWDCKTFALGSSSVVTSNATATAEAAMEVIRECKKGGSGDSAPGFVSPPSAAELPPWPPPPPSLASDGVVSSISSSRSCMNGCPSLSPELWFPKSSSPPASDTMLCLRGGRELPLPPLPSPPPSAYSIVSSAVVALVEDISLWLLTPLSPPASCKIPWSAVLRLYAPAHRACDGFVVGKMYGCVTSGGSSSGVMTDSGADVVCALICATCSYSVAENGVARDDRWTMMAALVRSDVQ